MNFFETLILRYFEYLESKGKGFNLVVGFLCTATIGTFDILTANEIKHSFLYLLPIAFVAWFSGIRPALVISLICTGLWSVNNFSGSLLVFFWNIVSTSVFFMAIAAFLNKTRQLWENEKTLSSTDPLTGAKNLRAFTGLAEHEILRSCRDGLPFSLAYFDLDNFKAVNDNFGHNAGDKLLRSIVDNMVKNLRRTDIVGRLGGDEFAIFFPETNQDSVRVVMEKICSDVNRQMEEMEWATTFSMGVITCSSGVYSFQKLIKKVDRLMYEVKHSGKNNIRFLLCSEESILDESDSNASLAP